MTTRRDFVAGAAALLAAAPRGADATPRASGQPAPSPPVAKRVPERSVHHGIERIDDYAWLRDPDWREAIKDPSSLRPEIRDYIAAENTYAEAVLKPLQPLKKTLLDELNGRIEQAYGSVPMRDGPYFYWTRYLPGAEHAQYVRAPTPDAAVEVLLDADLLAKGRDYFSVGETMHSPDHKSLAYLVDTSGAESFDLYIRKIGAESAPRIVPGVADFVWAADSESIVYVRRDEEMRPRLVFLHRIGANPETDAKLYEEPDALFSLAVALSSTKKRIVIASGSSDTAEAWLVDAGNPASPFVNVAPRRHGVRYFVDDLDERLIIRTDADGAEDFKLVSAPISAPSAWTDEIPHRAGVQIENVVTRAGFLARLEMEDGQQRLVVQDMSDNAEHTVDFPDDVYVLGLSQPFDYAEPVIRLAFSSPITPQRVYDYDMAQRKLTLRREQKVPSGHDPSRYVVRRMQAPAADGETVPVTLIHLKDLPLDGSAPALLSGYGAYATSIAPEFNENAFSLVDRGFVYARAHVRGGLEKGNRWRDGGRLKNKPNTFTDYIAACEHLIRLGYTARGRIVANGASAGGMLVGAVANMRPDLFAGMIAQVPFVDCLATMLDESLPLTTTDRPEWGDPIESADDYRLIASYSPYDNVKPQHYPPMFVTAGISDPRVTYWEPAKWVARLRATRQGDSRITLTTRMAAGHFGAPGRFQGQEEVALVYAFALDVTGLRDAKPRP